MSSGDRTGSSFEGKRGAHWQMSSPILVTAAQKEK
jgi:hypothetical protein